MIPKLEELKRLFWEEWDPIGMRRIGGPADEYDSYAFEIWMRLKRGVSVDDVADYLQWAETTNMGLSQPSGRGRKIAERAVAIGG